MTEKHTIDCTLYRSQEGIWPYWFGSNEQRYSRYCRVKDIEKKFQITLRPGASMRVRVTIEELTE